MDKLSKRIYEFVHELNQCIVAYGTIHPPIRSGTWKMVFVEEFTPNCLLNWGRINLSPVWMGLGFEGH